MSNTYTTQDGKTARLKNPHPKSFLDQQWYEFEREVKPLPLTTERPDLIGKEFTGELVWQYKSLLDGLNWETDKKEICSKYPLNRQALSVPVNVYLINEADNSKVTDNEHLKSVPVKGEEKAETIVLDINDFAISEEDLERAFAFGYLANPENNCLDNKEMMRRYEIFKNQYLLPMLQRKHIID